MSLSYNSSSPSLFDYLLVYLVVSASGMHWLMANEFLVFLFVLLTAIFVLKKTVVKVNITSFLTTLIFAVFIFVLQSVKFGVFITNSFLSLIIVFSVAFLISSLLKERYLITFVRLAYFFSVISLLFYFLGLLFPQIHGFFTGIVKTLGTDPLEEVNLLFYNFRAAETTVSGSTLLRNSGFLYEPGMFACILIPALAFNTIIRGSLSNKYNIVFIVTILTTFSTAAYLALVVFLVLYATTFKGFSLKRSIVVIAVVIVSAGAFWRLDFIGAKIEEQYERAHSGSDYQRYQGRIGSALVDWQEVINYPLTGRGRHAETRFDQDKLSYNPHFSHRVNGVFYLMASMGIPFFIFYLFILYKSVSSFCSAQHRGNLAWLVFIIPYLIMALSQTILMRPFFLSLLFLYHFRHKKNS